MSGTIYRNKSLLLAAGMLAMIGVAFLLSGFTGVVASVLFVPLLIWAALKPKRHEPLGRQIWPGRPDIIAALDEAIASENAAPFALVARIDDFETLEELYERPLLDAILAHTKKTFDAHFRDGDMTARLDNSCCAACLVSVMPCDLEGLVNLCNRIQHDLAEPFMFQGIPLRWTLSIGFANASRVNEVTGEKLLQAATAAQSEARRKGPGAVRGYSAAMSSRRTAQRQIGREAGRAFDHGDIFAYFQPQISIKDGTLSGFEALTRWRHPEKGLISPADFLPVLQQAGLMQRLGDTMITQAMKALRYWDENGLTVPRIGVNFSTDELRDHMLVDRIAMLLDAHDIPAQRLVVEVLETVVAKGSDDSIVHNLSALSHLGCGIDLDDFGTGYASITNIRRFSVGRIKIDRSYITGVDHDLEQREMVAAILTMADRLGVRTLAEGVETKGEFATLEALGCDTAQGFYIARPMPLEETITWAKQHMSMSAGPVSLSKRAS